MPAAVSQAIDWPGIRANAVSMGIRAAARAAAVNLPPDEQERFVKRALKRAEREGWVKAKVAAMSSAVVVNEKPLSSNVVSGADSVANQLREDGEQTRLGFSKAALKVAKKLPTLSDDELLDKDRAQSAKHWQAIAAGAQPGWEAEKKSDGGLVAVTLIRLELGSAGEKSCHGTAAPVIPID